MISKKQKEDILAHGIEDISSDITHIKLENVIHNFTDLKHSLDHVERPTGNLECLPLKDFCDLSHVYICMYYFNMIL